MIFKNLTSVQFLTHYWQKKPLLIRQAFPGFRDPLSPDELAGLSLEADVDSRLVMERGGKKPWEVTLGPQRSSKLRGLPRSHWTLLVQGVDRFVPGVAALLEPFRFIPDWRVEDVMVSFAPRAGTVGPHVDSYDVFLIQGKGRRRWLLDKNAAPEWRPGLDLRILKHFRATGNWVLEPGDMLYLPPGVAHYGTALEECLTYSVGFRAPSGLDLLLATQERLSRSGASPRYSDPELRPSRLSGEIPRASLQKMRRLMSSALDRLGDAEFDALAGALLTEPKGSAAFPSARVSVKSLRSKLAQGAALRRTPGARLAFLTRGTTTDLFANGRRFSLPRHLKFAAPLLTQKHQIPAGSLRPHLQKSGFSDLLANLMSEGAFQLESASA